MTAEQRKGVLVFLAITFGITYAIEFGMIAAGMRFAALTAVWLPTVAK